MVIDIVSMLCAVSEVFRRDVLLLDLEKKLLLVSPLAPRPGFVGVSKGGSSVRTFLLLLPGGETSVVESAVFRSSLLLGL
jgi:hypothetical protein